MIELQALAKSYGGTAAVHDVTFHVSPGEFVTLLGPSGCGKTTTLRMVAGFVPPSSGTIMMRGEDVTRRPPHRREVGLVFQSYALFPHMTVSRNVGFGLQMRGRPADDIAAKVAEALSLVRLTGFEDRLPKALSGGQQQRVALARALVIRPLLLLLDEPFGALDKQLRDHMQVELRALQRQLNLPTIFVTHDQNEALSMSDRVVVMNAGRVEQIGAPTDLYERPCSTFVATFLGHSNVLASDSLRQNGGLPARGGGGASSRAGGKVMIRPERITLRPPSRAWTDETVGIVRTSTYLGPSIAYTVAVGDLVLEVIVVNTGEGSGLPRPGDRVALSIPEDAIWSLRD